MVRIKKVFKMKNFNCFFFVNKDNILKLCDIAWCNDFFTTGHSIKELFCQLFVLSASPSVK